MKPELAPCPFCFGRKAIMAVHATGCQVSCTDCNATGPSRPSRKDALIVWNALSEELAKTRQWYANDFAEKLDKIQKSVSGFKIVRRATGH